MFQAHAAPNFGSVEDWEQGFAGTAFAGEVLVNFFGGGGVDYGGEGVDVFLGGLFDAAD